MVKTKYTNWTQKKVDEYFDENMIEFCELEDFLLAIKKANIELDGKNKEIILRIPITE